MTRDDGGDLYDDDPGYDEYSVRPGAGEEPWSEDTRARRRLHVRQERVYVRRRRAAAGALGALAALLVVGMVAFILGRGGQAPSLSAGEGRGVTAAVVPPADVADESAAPGTDEGAEEEGEEAEETSAAPAAPWQQETGAQAHPSDETALTQLDYLTEGTPKSVVASGHGLMITNNMMYSHTSTIFDSTSREVLTRLDDSLDLSEYGVEGHPGVSVGSPVEATWTDDGRYAYVSNYSMYGENFGREGFDDCFKDSGVGASTVYRFDAEEMAWDEVIEVGAVPKYLEITPDQKTLLVSNWCDYTVSVVDMATGEETGTLDVGRNPRGIVVMPDNRTALVTAMWNQQVWRLDLEEMTSEVVLETPPGPRHLNLTADGETAYLTVARSDLIYKLDAQTMEIVDEVVPGLEPRSMAMSPDEKALYVVNYDEATVSKIRTSDMEVIDKVDVDAVPIGIDYDPVTHTVWVACYNGGIYVFDDQDTRLADAG
ncbi:YncE family protein [Ornithinimicrobium cerasi]|uniref:YncE family protein n=1 Tax=Ornithinimicrobium cerasi TaxID=2248773 RepID=UPI00137B7CDA|nr:YncE family protein [Ornithinimicrobium cerasi]